MKNLIYKILGIKINRSLYKRDIYYFLHGANVAANVSAVLSALFLILFLFPEMVSLIGPVIIAFIFLFFVGITWRRITHAKGDALDFLYRAGYYRATGIMSTVMIIISAMMVVLSIPPFKEAMQMPLLKLSQILVLCLVYLSSSSILMLKTAFKEGAQ